MKEIALGVFKASFWRFTERMKWSVWGFYIEGKSDVPIPENFNEVVPYRECGDISFYANIYQACIVADIINMLLDHIILPLDVEQSITCAELRMILHYPVILEKTRFWLNERLLDKDKVLDIIQRVKDQGITFNDIQF